MFLVCLRFCWSMKLLEVEAVIYLLNLINKHHKMSILHLGHGNILIHIQIFYLMFSYFCIVMKKKKQLCLIILESKIM